eukprot:4690836-Pyramimonas_sp.AAC.2
MSMIRAAFTAFSKQASMLDAVQWRLVHPLSPKTTNSSLRGDVVMERICGDEQYAIETYDAWNQHVIDNVVPKQRLFVFESGKTDYNELAAFLG